MFTFIKKILGYPTDAEKTAAKEQAEAPYKVESTVRYEDIKPQAVELTPVVAPVPAGDIAPQPVAEAKPAKAAKKKAPAAKKPAGAKKGGRKPKSQAQ